MLDAAYSSFLRSRFPSAIQGGALLLQRSSPEVADKAIMPPPELSAVASHRGSGGMELPEAHDWRSRGFF